MGWIQSFRRALQSNVLPVNSKASPVQNTRVRARRFVGVILTLLLAPILLLLLLGVLSLLNFANFDGKIIFVFALFICGFGELYGGFFSAPFVRLIESRIAARLTPDKLSNSGFLRMFFYYDATDGGIGHR